MHGILLSEEPLNDVIKELFCSVGDCCAKTVQVDAFNLLSALTNKSFNSQLLGTNQKFSFQYKGRIYDRNECNKTFIEEAITIALEKHDCLENRFNFISCVHSQINKYENDFALAIVVDQRVYFFKDDIGKKSLGYSEAPFILSSIHYDSELDPLKLYVYDAVLKRLDCSFKERSIITEAYFKQVKVIQQYLKMYPNDYKALTEYSDEKLEKDEELMTQTTNASTKYHEELSFLLLKSCKLRYIPGSGNKNEIVFFSGGIDSFIITLFIHFTVNQNSRIVLINTAVPGSFDRNNGLKGIEALKKHFPEREFLFVENNISADEIKRHDSKIKELMYPKTKQMDFNIASVLYFSARCAAGIGQVVYLGSGADELFGGYNRYKTDTSSRDRMFFDLFTISIHNICRDDRIISHYGLEARIPFLDYQIVKFSLDLPFDSLIRRIDSTIINKAILRDLLIFHGFSDISLIPKKAMQYGTGINKFEKELSLQ
ncbi:hypothetical protein GINT2_000883 [Glugoides intestinalis]